MEVIHHSVNLSDHNPLVMKILFNRELLTLEPKFHVQRRAWYRANEGLLNEYKLRLELFLRGINVPVSALTCRDLICRNADHFHKLNMYAKDISIACRSVKRDEQVLVRQCFADALLSNNNSDLWSEVKPINGKKAMPAGVMDSLSTPENIAECFCLEIF